MNDLTMLESSLLWELLRGPRPNKHLNPPPLNFNDEQRQRVAMLFGTFAAQFTQKVARRAATGKLVAVTCE